MLLYSCCAEHDPEDAWTGEEVGLEDTDEEELDRPAKRYRSPRRLIATNVHRMLVSMRSFYAWLIAWMPQLS